LVAPDDIKHGHFQAASAHYLAAGPGGKNLLVSRKHIKAESFHTVFTIEPDGVQ
jgi:hypothetical protein